MRPDRQSLARLYETERTSTRAIGALFGVSKTEVRRWLADDGIAARPKGRGLANRGVAAPTADELRRMIHGEHLSYLEIAARFGVDDSAVQHWLRRHGIPRPRVWDTRRKGRVVREPTADELRALYDEGLSAARIGDRLGLSESAILVRLAGHGIARRDGGWQGGRRWTCADGHRVRSSYEQRVDDWLSANGVEHVVEPPLPFGSTSRADFLARGWYVEVWGVVNRRDYAKRKGEKRALYATHGLPLIEINPDDFSAAARDRYVRKLAHHLLGAHEFLPRTAPRTA